MRKGNTNRINYIELNKRISKNEISPVYVFSGNQAYPMAEALENLKAKVLGQSSDFNLSIFFGDSATARDIINTARTHPMLYKMRLVTVKGADKLSSHELKLLEEYLSQPSPFTCLVLTFTEEKKLSLGDKEHVVFVDFTLNTNELRKVIKDDVKKSGYDITGEAIETLVSLVGEDLQDIHTETEKLKLLTMDKKRIEAVDVERLTEKVRFEDVFQLTNAVLNKDKKRALKILLDLESKNEEPISVLNALSRRFRLLWKAKELLEEKASQSTILKELKVSPGALFYIRQEVQSLHYQDMKRINIILSEVDGKLKRSYAPRNMSLTKLVLELCK
ncbi:MAG TPA: DNA polymerase III subunit delta [Thermodesulfobacteriota bacterium]|nr:DNA polymerase III subunit delta [Thermodesulfobacteriota bacterium]